MDAAAGDSDGSDSDRSTASAEGSAKRKKGAATSITLSRRRVAALEESDDEEEDESKSGGGGVRDGWRGRGGSSATTATDAGNRTGHTAVVLGVGAFGE